MDSNKPLGLGFSTSQADSSLFTFIRSSLQIYFLVYVDDIVIAGFDTTAIDMLPSTLRADFPIKDLGRQHYFLGVKVHHSPSGILLTQ